MKAIRLLLIFFTCATANAQYPVLSSYPSARATLYIDFDGQYVTGTAWNYSGDINAQPAGLTTAAMSEIFNRVAEDFRPFDLNVTTDSTVYWAAPANKRMRVIVTPTSQWYGAAGGVAYVGSFKWGDNTPAWVFSALLSNRTKYVAEAISHEAGHTLGLQHQSIFDASCNKTAEYSTGLGTGEIGWAPIMGAGYYQNHTTWNVGPSSLGCSSIQNDFNIIATQNGFGLRSDEHGNDNSSATPVVFAADAFTVSGLINTAPDIDVFRIDVTSTSWLSLHALPQSVGVNDDGANLDIKLSLLNNNDTIGNYNPSTLLNAGVDTNLNAGTYFLVVRGTGNIYHDTSGNMGLYAIDGNLAVLLPIHITGFSGRIVNGQHLLNWSVQTDESIASMGIESSADGHHFALLQTLPAQTRSFIAEPHQTGPQYYRLRVTTSAGRISYAPNKVVLTSNTIGGVHQVPGSSVLTVRSDDRYAYRLLNASGQLIASGQLQPGLNALPSGSAHGLLVLQYGTRTEKLIQP